MVTGILLVCAGLLWLAGTVCIAAGEATLHREGKEGLKGWGLAALFGAAALALAYIAGTLT